MSNLNLSAQIRLSQYFQDWYSFAPLGWGAVQMELEEVFEASSWEECAQEMAQVAMYILIIVHQVFPFINPIVPDWMPWKEDYERLKKWEAIFSLAGAETEINLTWFIIGNNWRRPKKVVAILAKAGIEVNEEEALSLIERVS